MKSSDLMVESGRLKLSVAHIYNATPGSYACHYHLILIVFVKRFLSQNECFSFLGALRCGCLGCPILLWQRWCIRVWRILWSWLPILRRVSIQLMCNNCICVKLFFYLTNFFMLTGMLIFLFFQTNRSLFYIFRDSIHTTSQMSHHCNIFILRFNFNRNISKFTKPRVISVHAQEYAEI